MTTNLLNSTHTTQPRSGYPESALETSNGAMGALKVDQVMSRAPARQAISCAQLAWPGSAACI